VQERQGAHLENENGIAGRLRLALRDIEVAKRVGKIDVVEIVKLLRRQRPAREAHKNAK